MKHLMELQVLLITLFILEIINTQLIVSNKNKIKIKVESLKLHSISWEKQEVIIFIWILIMCKKALIETSYLKKQILIFVNNQGCIPKNQLILQWLSLFI